MKMPPSRLPEKSALRPAVLALALASAALPSPASAYPTPGTSGADGPAEFLPAPNPTAYCDSVEYFSPWSLNAAVANGTASPQTITTDTASTEDNGQGIVATFTTTTSGSNNGGLATPNVNDFAGTNAVGIIMNAPAAATISLSEPLFYSQWIFTDVDLATEGFQVTPNWSTSGGQVAGYGGDAQFDFTGSTANLAQFVDIDDVNSHGYLVETRAQVDLLGAVTGFDVTKIGPNSGGSGMVGGGGCPAIGLSKTATAPVWDPATQTFNVDFTIRVKNNLPTTAQLASVVAAGQAAAGSTYLSGAPTGIDHADLQISDSFEMDGFSSAVVSNLASTNLTVDSSFDGQSSVDLLSGNDTLVAQGEGEVTFSVAYTPELPNAVWADCAHGLENQASVTADADGVAVSDTSDNGPDPSPAALNEAGSGADDPTPLAFSFDCGQGLAKTISQPATINPDGTFDVQYTLTAENYGDVDLSNVSIDDDLTAAFGAGLVSSTVASDTCAAGTLAHDSSCSKVLDVVFSPAGAGSSGPYVNSAVLTVSGAGGTLTDTSHDGTDPDPEGDGAGDNSTPTTFSLAPQIGLSKAVSDGPTNNGDGTYTVEYTLVATNTGEVQLTNPVISDDLSATFGSAFTSSATTSNNCTGVALAPGASCSAVIEAVVTPGPDLGPYNNSASVSSTGPGGPVTDVSNNVTADGDSDGDPTNDSDPTPVSFTESPEVDLSKAVSDGPTNNGDGTYTVEYTLVATNTGDVQLTNPVIGDDLTAVFGSALVSSTVDSNSCDGATLAAPASGAAGGSCTMVVSVVARPGANLGSYDNVGTVSATSPAGVSVTDGSNGGAVTPVSFTESPEVDLSKAVSDGPTNNGDGTYTVEYTLVAMNIGDVQLTNPVIGDDLVAVFGSALVSSTVDSNSCDGATLAAPASGAAGGSCTMVVSVVARPGANLGSYDNVGTVSATSPAGVSVTDSSNGGAVTPVSFTESPQIDLSKAVSDGPTNNGDGTYTVEYTLVATNTGDVQLTNPVIGDDLTAVFGSALVSSTVDSNSCDGATLASGAAGGSCTMVVSVVARPGANLGSYDNVGTVSATSPAGVSVTDSSNGGAVTPVSFTESPQIGVTKAAVNLVSNGDGTYTIDYVMNVTNTGDVVLTGLMLVDDLDATFGSASYDVDSVDASAGAAVLAANSGYTGAAGADGVVDSDDLLDGTNELSPGATGVVIVTVTFTPAGNVGPFDNSASASGTSPSGASANDTSNDSPFVDADEDGDADDTDGDGTPDHLDPDPDGDGDPSNNSMPTTLAIPGIGVTKSITAVTNNGDGTYDVAYEVVATNVGTTSLENVQIVDSLATTFSTASAWSLTSLSSTELTTNDAFDGSGTTELLAGSDTLAVGATGAVALVVTITPGAELGTYANTATGTGSAPAQVLPDGSVVPGPGVIDDSDNTAPGDHDPDGDGNGDPTTDDDPTPLDLTEDPEIAVTKGLQATPVVNADGTFSLRFVLNVSNTGDIVVHEVMVADDLRAVFGPGADISVDSVSVSLPGMANPSYDGVFDTELVEATTLPVGETIELVIDITVGSLSSAAFSNTATATGVSPAGRAISDDSQDQAAVVGDPNGDPDGDGDPTNNDDPTEFVLVVDPADDLDEGNARGSVVTVDPLANDSGFLDPTTVQLLDPVTGLWVSQFVVAGEGLWTVDSVSGLATFEPEADFTGDPTPVAYRVQVMGSTEFAQAEITITYFDPVVPSRLAFTGASSTGLIRLSMALLTLGGGLVLGARRRKQLI